MLDLCKAKNIYKELKCMFCGAGELPQAFKDTFDVSIGSGIFLPGHMPGGTIKEMYESVKIGGFIFFTLREDYFECLPHKKEIEQLEKEGKVKLIDSSSCKKFDGIENSEENLGVFKSVLNFAFCY